MNALAPMFGGMVFGGMVALGVVFAFAEGDDPVPVTPTPVAVHNEDVFAPPVSPTHTRIDDVAIVETRDDEPAVAGDDADRRFADLVAAIDLGADDLDQVRALRDLLVGKPALAANVVQLVRAPARTERCRMRLLQSLQLCGDDGCQRALAAIAGADDSLRERALRALGSVATPSAVSLDVLWSHAVADRESVALLAFARATASVRATDGPLHEQCCELVRFELQRAVDPDRESGLLKALAAAGDARAADDAVRFATSLDATVRRTAVQVLVASRLPGHELVVRDLLANETDAEVRRIAERGLAMGFAARSGQ